jgi:3D (Asp-Asp-Asp) domain-containing protein
VALHAYVLYVKPGLIFGCTLIVIVVSALLLITAFASQQGVGIDLSVHPEVEVLPASKARFLRAEVDGEEHGPLRPRYTLKATAYNSVPEQTNSQPFITATGASTRFGIIAVSRDLLPRHIPYGSLVRIYDLGNYHDGRGYGKYQALLDGHGYFIVEDTMHMRKQEQIDLWFATVPEALEWGVRRVEVEVVRYGREGPLLEASAGPFEVSPVFMASR